MLELTPEQVREHHLSRIRDYAVQHDLADEDIALIFNAGLAAARSLRPDLVEIRPKGGTQVPEGNETAGALSFTGEAIGFRTAESAGSEVRSLVGRANCGSQQELT
ncbi:MULTISPECIES: hypothetical protein [Bacillati]|nr:hypothetical protein [Stenotrophomonas maltophilia]MBH1503351.1 hypothetical protein [Stenotrophomonas maltophilia]MBH1784023.1 hypothetical protein [Stenotrophomonas maltophilia]